MTAKPKDNGLSRPLDQPQCPITGTGLPSEWRICQIKEAYQFTSKPRGLSFENEPFVPFLPMEQIPIGRPYAETYEKKAVENLTSGTYVENGDLLVAKITPSFENGKQAVVKWDRPCGYATTEVIPLQAIEGIGDRDFLAHLLLHPEVRSNLAGKMDGTTGRQRLSKETLGSRLMALPPLPEQKKIAQILSTVQRAVEDQQRIIQTIRELKKTLVHKLFTEGLRNEPQKQTEIGPVPQSWEVTSVGEICRSIVPGRNKPKVFDGDIPWLTTPNIKGLDYINADVDGLRVSEKELKSSGGRLIPPKSVIMSCVGEFGVSAVTNVEIVINQQLHAFVCPANLSPVFLCNLLRYRKHYLESIAAITTIPYINKSKCESVPNGTGLSHFSVA